MTKALDSREFKLILKPKLFQDINAGIEKVQKVIDLEVEKLNGIFKPEQDLKLKQRNTYYLDTSDFALKSKNFFLRIREDTEPPKYDITLKCRHPDRYISSAYDFSDSIIHKVKFEEDIIAPHVSKFSTSVNLEQDLEPKFNSIEVIKSTFPGLSSYDLGDGKLLKVNNFEAKEISVSLGKITYDRTKGKKEDEDKIKLLLNFWYFPKNEGLPVIVEFTYSYKVIEVDSVSEKNKNKERELIEEFPLSLVNNTYEFYKSLQDTEIADLRASKTKTEFAYNFK
jgi:hypothetical protein